jgi:hypothetical protein
LTATLPSGAISDSTPSPGFSVTTMTRSGAPVQGASGDGKTVTSAGFAQPSDAAAAGDSAVEKSSTNKPPATGKNAIAAAAKRRARSI